MVRDDVRHIWHPHTLGWLAAMMLPVVDRLDPAAAIPASKATIRLITEWVESWEDDVRVCQECARGYHSSVRVRPLSFVAARDFFFGLLGWERSMASSAAVLVVTFN